MKLTKVNIKNFRSIKDLTIGFEPSFKILVGKNESGKSNIIKALSLLSEEYEPALEDKREFLPEEKVENEYYVRFVFKLDEKEINDIYQLIQAETTVKPDKKIISHFKTEYTLHEFVKAVAYEGLYRINIVSKVKDFSYWKISEYYKFLPNIKRLKTYAKKKTADDLTNVNSLFVDTTESNEVMEDFYIAAPISEVNDLIGKAIRQKVEENLPNLIFWKYDESSILPNRINVSTFSSNPDSCIPLKILFNFAGYEDIQTSISECLKAKGNQFDNLLKRISVKATKHFNEVWKEYPNISFSFTHNGDSIIAAIQEENKYPLIQRSDGFKRFVTFLILISACAKNDDLENTILLFDEPDTSLHPSGVRYLRDELIRVSKNNYIVAATHSIFLIDNECIERHYIVTKDNEQTSIKIPEGDDLFEEEVLYKAVGYSLYEVLKTKNLVFEGWRDKCLFKQAINSCPVKYKKLKKEFSSIGFCQSNGVKGMKALTPIFEAACRKCLIITDNDEPAKQRQSEYSNIKGFGIWKTYKEIDNGCNAITGEDFLTKTYIKEKIKVLKKQNIELKGEPDFNDLQNGVISCVKKWLSENNSQKPETVKNLLSEYKTLLFENLTQKQIDESYYKFLTKLIKEIGSL